MTRPFIIAKCVAAVLFIVNGAAAVFNIDWFVAHPGGLSVAAITLSGVGMWFSIKAWRSAEVFRGRP